MKRMFFSMAECSILLICVALCSGCGKPSLPLVPVSGKVTVGDKPVTSGQVTLIPLEKNENQKDSSSGSIDENGEYKIFTGGGEGAPLGKYKVTVTPLMMPSGNTKAPSAPFARKYGDATATTLKIEVVSNPAAGAYDLKLTN
jgi:hypothetical protein